MYAKKINFIRNVVLNSKLAFLFLTFTLLFVTNSCEFTPTGTDYVEISPKEPVAFINLDFAVDTIKIWGSKYLDYWIDIGERYPDSVNFYLDNKLISYSRSLSDSIMFNSDLYPDGTHTIKIKVLANSGSGSISDVLGAEKVLFTKEWTLIINNANPGLLKIKSAKPVDGRLRIEWEKFNQFNFNSYYLYKNNALVGVFKNKDTNYWIDTGYVCGNADYRVDLQASNSLSIGIPFNYSGNYSEITNLTVTDSNYVKITWSKNLFYNNFGSYAVYGGFGYNAAPLAVINNVNDTSFIDREPVFGSQLTYSVGVYLPGTQDYTGILGNSGTPQKCSIGNKILNGDYVQFFSSMSSIYIIDFLDIYRIDPVLCTEIAHNSLPNTETRYFSISPDGKNLYMSADTKFIKFDPLTLEIQESIPTRSIMGYTTYIKSNFNVTDSNIICFSSFLPGSGTGTFIGNYKFTGNVIINMNSKTIIDTLSAAVSDYNCSIANNNKYFFSKNNLYTISNNKLNKIAAIPGSRFNFIENGEKYIVSNNNLLQVNNTNDLRNLYSFPVDLFSDYYYDIADNFMGITMKKNDKYYFVIYNLRNGEQLKEVQVADYYNYYFANSILFTAYGYYLPLMLN